MADEIVRAMTEELDRIGEDVLAHIRAGEDCPVELGEAWGTLMNELMDTDPKAFSVWLAGAYERVR